MERKAVPKETWYGGYRFRSRLEARWAVYFDAMGIEYRYEPEGYELKRYDGTTVSYLPDFYFPDMGTWGEVKGNMTPEDREKIELFRSQVGTLTVFGDIPAPTAITSPRRRIALSIARSARFEWGDTPDPQEIRQEVERMLRG